MFVDTRSTPRDMVGVSTIIRVDERCSEGNVM